MQNTLEPAARQLTGGPIANPGRRSLAESRTALPRLGYILSASHSGSTLLAMLLGAHPDVCSPGELRGGHAHQPGYRCSCGVPIAECDFWRRVAERMARRGMDFDIRTPGTDITSVGSTYAERLLRPLQRGALAERFRDAALALSGAWRSGRATIQRRNAALVRSICEVAHSSVVVDSSKGATRAKYLLRNAELDVRIVRLIRDGRAVMLTYMNPVEFANTTNPRFRQIQRARMSPEQAAHQWKRANEAADCLMAALPPSRGLVVRYEDYCENPRHELKRIFEFLGVDPLQVNLAFRSVQQHVIGNQMRFDKTSDVRLDERWRAGLSTDEVSRFEQVGGALNRRYGYE